MKRSSGWNQEVTDAQGRRRFHGAFTGGFSAGYYNSVGTEEGWQPATFESSRASRSARTLQQRAEDFMDEEDDPLLGKRLETAEAYDTLQATARQRVHDGILGDAAAAKRRDLAVLLVPDELVLPASGDSIGKKLLSQMGWREGHGIGPKLRRKRTMMEDGNDGNADEQHGDDVFVAPRNVINVKVFPKPKMDKYGAGFDPFVDAPEFLRHKQQQPETKAAPAREIVTFAQALGGGGGGASRAAMGFGLSALEENDDLDVYGTTSMDDFDRAIAPAGESMKLLDSMSSHARAKKRERDREVSATLCSDGRPALPGFRIAGKKEKPPQSVSERLDVPSDFRAYHVFDEREEASSVSSLYSKFNFSTEKSGRGSMMTAKRRAEILDGSVPTSATPQAARGDRGTAGSVFDMMDPSQREKLMNAAQAVKERKPLTQGAPSEQFRANVSASIAKRFVSASTEGGNDQVNTTSSMDVLTTVKKSYRTEGDWAPHVLLCKRFHVKCQGQTISGGKEVTDGAGQDLFTKELAPHLLDFAAAGHQAGIKGREASVTSNVGDTATDSLPPLPVVPKPSADLLRSIFEPSDESEVEEDSEDEEQDKDADEHENDHVKVPKHTAASPNEASLDVLDPPKTDLVKFDDSEDSSSDDSMSSEDESSKKRKRSDRADERSSKKHKKSKHKKEKDSKKAKKAKKSKKSKKSSHSDRDSSSRSSRRDRESRRSRSRSRSRDRTRSRDRSRGKK